MTHSVTEDGKMQGRNITGWLYGRAEDNNLRVGAGDATRNYTGPVAEIKVRDEFLYIVTDPYEGAAMMNVETLPFLIKALQETHRHLKRATKEQG